MSRSSDAGVPSSGFTFREAARADIPEMVELVNAAFEVEAFFVDRPRTHGAQLEEQFRVGHFWLAHQDGRLMATVYCEARGEHGYIGMLAVRPGNQGSGLGRAMTQLAERCLRGLGCSIATLTVVSVRTELLPIYRKLGYEERGIEEPYEDLRKKLTMPVKLIRMEKAL